MQKIMKNKGITLVSLVVTIVILLILAGVTLNIAISENGIFSKAKKATKEYQIASEREYLEQNILSVQLDKYMGNVSSEKLGKSLVDRNLENSSIWDIIVEKSENKTYGTGWNYLEKGTILEDYGETKYNWIVNYETGEIIQLEDESYNNFDYKSTIAVDNPLFNLDSANVGLDKASWGKNATLYYYDNEKYGTVEERKKAYEEQKGKNVAEYNSGYDRQKSENISEYIDEETGAFNFNGNNYIEIYNKNGFDFTEGLTFEFYGKITGVESATYDNGRSPCVFLSMWDGEYLNQSDIRFAYDTVETNYFWFNLNLHGVADSKWGDVNNPHNQIFVIKDFMNIDRYLTITFESETSGRIAEAIYLDGKLLDSTSISNDYYSEFLNLVKNIKLIELGRGTVSLNSNWCYLKGLCYTARLYNKGLTKEEVQANYETTTKYHKYIVDNKK